MIGNILAGIYDAGGIPGDFESIATVSLTGGAQATVEFTSIPSGYQHLQLRAIARSTTSAASANTSLTFNGSATSYSCHILRGDGSSVTSAAYTSMAFIYGFEIPAATATSGFFGGGVLDILDYTSTNKNKTVRHLAGTDRNGSGSVALTSGLWYATPAAITTLTLTTTGNFAQYSHFALYGIKG